MFLGQKIFTLVKLGEEFKKMTSSEDLYNFTEYNNIFVHNPWFIREFVEYSLKQWSAQLNEQNLFNWLKKYNLPENPNTDKTLGIICAGNIPMVALHDIICCYLTGTQSIVKMSSKDNILTKYVLEKLYEFDPQSATQISYTEEQLLGIDAIIATGNNTTNQYFDQYFGNKPHIFRQQKNSVAIISQNDQLNDFQRLADDVFLYFGLGCRNVSKIFVPKDFDFNELGKAFQKYKNLSDHYKYHNNLTYQYAMLAMNQIVHINFENLLLVENQDINSPIGILHYEYYDNKNDVKNFLSENEDKIQCVVSRDKTFENAIDFGNAQNPQLDNYADNIDTINFLLKLQKCR